MMSLEQRTDFAERDRLVLQYAGLVKTTARRLAQRLPSHVEVADLISIGVLGLIDAASRYQPSTGVPFDAFARRRVHGAMLDALREHGLGAALAAQDAARPGQRDCRPAPLGRARAGPRRRSPRR